MKNILSWSRDVSPPQASPGRRDLLKGAGALGLASLAGPVLAPFQALAAAGPADALVVPLTRGPYQNDGASPWSAELPVGSAGQTLKLCLDSGSNFIWMTSSVCSANRNLCQHYGGGQFQYQQSRSFQWVDQTPKPVSFGPWGTMTVASGKDLVGLPGGRTQPTTFYLAENYSGSQFAQLNWDGGIGIPSGSAYVDPGVSFFVADLMDAGLMDPAYPYVSFNTDPVTGIGTCRFGMPDLNALDPLSGIRMPWQPYTAFKGVEYIWTTPLNEYRVGDLVVASNKMFCLDSGSSQFKGDDGIMSRTLDLIRSMPVKPSVYLTLGTSMTGGPGRLTVPPSAYEVLIQAGPDLGKVQPQFQPLGLTDLVLVGSVLMDLFYTIYEYSVTVVSGRHVLKPVAMYLFDKPGRQFIADRGTATAGNAKILGPKSVGKEPS
ncbi:MAG TPA: pepsin-like aspartyl protease [Azospirillum sp.]|nr:pepsin-like aspartyl protease [Azospirillum sp.]